MYIYVTHNIAETSFILCEGLGLVVQVLFKCFIRQVYGHTGASLYFYLMS